MSKQILAKSWRPVSAIIVGIVMWEVATRMLAVEEWILPAPSRIILEATDVLPAFWPHLLATLKLATAGFAIGTSIGLGVATLLHRSEWMRNMFYPFLILSQNIPIIVLAPLLLIWFGFGSFPKLIIITLASFFPIAMSALGGLQQTRRELLHYMKMMGASKKQLFWKLELPHALPSVFSGLKIAATYSVMAAVISEWLGAQKGIGVFMTLAASSYRTPRVFVAIIVTMFVSLVFFAVIVLLERFVIRWQGKEEK